MTAKEMRLIDREKTANKLLEIAEQIEQRMGYEKAGPYIAMALFIRDNDKELPTVDAAPVKRAITALMDLRDAFVAKQPRGEWYKSDRAKGVEQGIEMAIQRVREMTERRESDAD